jgi:dipeptidyl-peptidase-3
MKLVLFLCCAVASGQAIAQAPKLSAPSPLITQVADTGFVRVEAHGFDALPQKQRLLAYWLTQASVAIDPIIYDQLSAYGLREKRLLEAIVAHPTGIDPHSLSQVTRYTELFWANRGNHNLETSQKFLPSFSFEELKTAALVAWRHGAMQAPYGDLPPLATVAQVSQEVDALRAAFFDLQFEPMATAKTPANGKDILQASSNTFYVGPERIP